MRKIFIILLVFFAFTSCKDEKDDNTPEPVVPKPENCKLIGIASPNFSQKIKYDDLGQISSVEFKFLKNNVMVTTTVTMQYDSNGKLLGMNSENFYSTLEYDSIGRVVSDSHYVRVDPSKPYVRSKRSFTYDDLNRLVKESYDDSFWKFYYRVTYDGNSNIMEVYYLLDDGTEFLRTEYTSYDDKKCPYYNLPYQTVTTLNANGVDRIEALFTAFQSKNNPLKGNLSYPNVQESVFKYQYNELGFPTSLVVETSGRTTIYNYEYACK